MNIIGQTLPQRLLQMLTHFKNPIRLLLLCLILSLFIASCERAAKISSYRTRLFGWEWYSSAMYLILWSVTKSG